jgi:hypothetical protein
MLEKMPQPPLAFESTGICTDLKSKAVAKLWDSLVTAHECCLWRKARRKTSLENTFHLSPQLFPAKITQRKYIFKITQNFQLTNCSGTTLATQEVKVGGWLEPGSSRSA